MHNYRLPSLPRKTMERKRGKLNGHLLREPSMDFSLQKLQTFSMIRIATESSLRLLSRPRDELKLQGKNQPHNLKYTLMSLCFQGSGLRVHQNNTRDVYNFFVLCDFRLRELHTLKGHVESVVKLKGLDIDTIQQHYTV